MGRQEWLCGSKLTSCHMFPGCEVKVPLLVLITPGYHSSSLNVTNGERDNRQKVNSVYN